MGTECEHARDPPHHHDARRAHENLTFRDITSDGVAGAVITVLGAEKKGSEREVETFARNVTVENCTLERSGKFMWDYGYLWQITVWPEDYNEAERAMAAKYFRMIWCAVRCG